MSQRGELFDDFLLPLSINLETCHELSSRFLDNFIKLAAESPDQFLPTPISDTILRPIADTGYGRHLAIDIGGTNLRVGFVELLGRQSGQTTAEEVLANGQSNGSTHASHRIRRLLEKSWPIAEHLKNDNSTGLFQWIGQCIVEVMEAGRKEFNLSCDVTLALGVTFSFPTQQQSLAEATVTSMGKGFTIPSGVNLGENIRQGYESSKTPSLPDIEVTAIANDSVATLVSFIYSYDAWERRRASIGLILGTGSNATASLRLSRLHHSKWPQNVSVLEGEKVEEARIAVNSEWSINGTAQPMRDLGLITCWDDQLSLQSEIPGFQPLEYMTAGRYLGELGRLVLLDYLTTTIHVAPDQLPEKLRQRHALTTTFLSDFRPSSSRNMLQRLQAEFPIDSESSRFVWTESHATALYRIAKAIEYRAAGIVASAIIALLLLGDEIPSETEVRRDASPSVEELGVGYTGGCISNFQDYLEDCQSLVDQLMAHRYAKSPPAKVLLSPCHDGGLTGAGILVAAALSSRNAVVS